MPSCCLKYCTKGFLAEMKNKSKQVKKLPKKKSLSLRVYCTYNLVVQEEEEEEEEGEEEENKGQLCYTQEHLKREQGRLSPPPPLSRKYGDKKSDSERLASACVKSGVTWHPQK